MQTQLPDAFKQSADGQEADRVLRSCVHCGFCNATCPTYQLLGDELDGPRGRIYQIKRALEGAPVSAQTQQHLDRCLTCRACETSCPSGVQYGRLLDIGRQQIDKQVGRSLISRLQRKILRSVLPFPQRLMPFIALGQWLRPVMPSAIRCAIPVPQPPLPAPVDQRHTRSMLLLDGCVQSVLQPRINSAAVLVLNQLGIRLVPAAGCCGAVSYHLSGQAEGLDFMRRNIDVLWPSIEQGAEAIVSTASGCGVMVKEYGHLLQHDPLYAEKAARVSALTRDLSEVLAGEDLTPLTSTLKPATRRVAFHAPCTLQHGQKLEGWVERILTGLGFELTPVQDGHLCCGSAGTYSILQKTLSQRLLTNKIMALEAGAPGLIATANIGCLLHLQSATGSTPVKHWIELLLD